MSKHNKPQSTQVVGPRVPSTEATLAATQQPVPQEAPKAPKAPDAPKVVMAQLTGHISMAGSIAHFRGDDVKKGSLPRGWEKLPGAEQDRLMETARAKALEAGERRKALQQAVFDDLAAKGMVKTVTVTVLDGQGQPVELTGQVTWNSKGTGLTAHISMALQVAVSIAEGKVEKQVRGFVPLY